MPAQVIRVCQKTMKLWFVGASNRRYRPVSASKSWSSRTSWLRFITSEPFVNTPTHHGMFSNNGNIVTHHPTQLSPRVVTPCPRSPNPMAITTFNTSIDLAPGLADLLITCVHVIDFFRRIRLAICRVQLGYRLPWTTLVWFKASRGFRGLPPRYLLLEYLGICLDIIGANLFAAVISGMNVILADIPNATRSLDLFFTDFCVTSASCIGENISRFFCRRDFILISRSRF